MKFKPMFSALLIAALPLAAQAGQASALTQQLNEPLSTASQTEDQKIQGHAPVADVSSVLVAEGSSAAMTKARLKLQAKQQHTTDIAVTGDPLALAHEATS
ncbi:hypothetical protein [Halomonas caseinilytica]|uniref:hypothetical protein n=1 Tax=Halomonas caseinilytica TaxID=438744 RepID=UPI0008490A4B|nr:hypothetical protein [Halomonas caseinilytica]